MFLKSLVVVLAVLFVSPALTWAHVGGHGAIAEVDVISIASEHVVGLIKDGIEIKGSGKLDNSWNKVPDSHKKINKKGSGYFVVSFLHPTNEKTLYLLISSSGALYDVNFTGQFEGLNK